MSGARSQFVVLLSARFGSAAIQAGVGIALARALAPEAYGTVVAVAGVMLFWSIVCDFGVSSYIARAHALDRRAEVETALMINVLTSSVSAVCAGAALLVVDPGGLPALALLPLVIGVAVDKNVDAALNVLIAAGRRSAPAVSVLTRRLVTAVVFVTLLAAGITPVWAYGLGMFAGPVIGQLHLRWALSTMGLHARKRDSIVGVLRESSLFAVNDVAIQSRSLDAAVVGLAAAPGAAGLYAAASKLTAPFELASSTLAAVVLPRAARAGTRRVAQVATLMFIVAVCLCAVIAPVGLLADDLIVAVLGQDYRSAGPALAVLLIALPVIGLSNPLSALLQGLGREQFVAATSVASGVTTLVAISAGAAVAGATGGAVGVAIVALLKCGVLLIGIVRLPASHQPKLLSTDA